MIVMNNLKIRVGKFKINLEFRSDIVAICGDSGTGKSLLVNLIKVYKTNEVKNSDGSVCKDIVFIDESNVRDISRLHGKLIIMDRFDYIQFTNACVKEEIKHGGSNQYILIGRKVGDYMPDHAGYAQVKNNGEEITLEYMYG